jgi:hypothetical protein
MICVLLHQMGCSTCTAASAARQVSQLTSVPLMHLMTSHLWLRSAVLATSWFTGSSSTDSTCRHKHRTGSKCWLF